MNVQETNREITETLGQIPEWVSQLPEEGKVGVWSIVRDFWLAETKLSNKEKELIGLAVSAATHCKYCAYFHTEAAKFFGATEQEIAEANMMGSFTMMASTFVNGQQIDYDQFKKETTEILDYVGQHAEEMVA